MIMIRLSATVRKIIPTPSQHPASGQIGVMEKFSSGSFQLIVDPINWHYSWKMRLFGY